MSSSEYLILNIGQHHFAANVSNIQDVIRSGNKTPVPLAKKSIGGLLNLRGHIVTEINVSETLGIKKETDTGFSIVINNNDELYSLPFDGIGDVIDVSASDIEPLPETIQRSWHQVATVSYTHLTLPTKA